MEGESLKLGLLVLDLTTLLIHYISLGRAISQRERERVTKNGIDKIYEA